MNYNSWNKIANNSTTSHQRCLKSTDNRYPQNDPRHHSTQIQEYLKKNLQGNRSIFNQIIHIKETGNKLIRHPQNTPTPDHIVDVVNSPLWDEWHDSIFANEYKMGNPTIFSAPCERSSLPPRTKILHPRISFRVKTTDIDNNFVIYSRTCEYGSSIIEGFYFTVSYTPVARNKLLRIIMEI